MESRPGSPGEVGNGVLSALHEQEAIPNKRSGTQESEKKQYTEKLFLPQALSEKTDAPELGVCVIQVSTANGRFGSVPARANTVFVR